MSLPPDCIRLMQDLGAAVCQRLSRTVGPSVLIVSDGRDSFLHGLMQSCAAGMSKTIRVFEAGSSAKSADPLMASDLPLGPLDGLVATDADHALLPSQEKRARPHTLTTSLDRMGLPLSHVAAIALGRDAMRAGVWRGAERLLARDRPVVVGYGPAESGMETWLASAGYRLTVFRYWAFPEYADLVLLAVPSDLDNGLRESEPSVQLALATPRVIRDALSDNRILPVGSAQVRSRFGAAVLRARQGLYPFETDYDYAVSWAWTGPGERTELILPQMWFGPHQIRIGVNDTFAPGGLAGLRFWINGRPVRSVVGEGCVTISSDVPPSEFTGELHLRIVTPSPRPIGNRRLGTSLAEVELLWGERCES